MSWFARLSENVVAMDELQVEPKTLVPDPISPTDLWSRTVASNAPVEDSTRTSMVRASEEPETRTGSDHWSAPVTVTLTCCPTDVMRNSASVCDELNTGWGGGGGG